MAELRGDGDDRRLGRIQEMIQMLITSTRERGEMYDCQHRQMMDEIRAQRAEIQDLLLLQKEQRMSRRGLFD